MSANLVVEIEPVFGSEIRTLLLSRRFLTLRVPTRGVDPHRKIIALDHNLKTLKFWMP